MSSVLSEITHHKTKAHQSRGERTLPCAIFVREALEEVENGNWCSGFNWATWPPCGDQLWASPSHHIVILVLIAIIINMFVINIITINVTRPKPAYGRQGLAGSWGQDTDKVSTFMVFLTSHFAPAVLSSDLTNLGPLMTLKIHLETLKNHGN